MVVVCSTCNLKTRIKHLCFYVYGVYDILVSSLSTSLIFIFQNFHLYVATAAGTVSLRLCTVRVVWVIPVSCLVI